MPWSRYACARAHLGLSQAVWVLLRFPEFLHRARSGRRNSLSIRSRLVLVSGHGHADQLRRKAAHRGACRTQAPSARPTNLITSHIPCLLSRVPSYAAAGRGMKTSDKEVLLKSKGTSVVSSSCGGLGYIDLSDRSPATCSLKRHQLYLAPLWMCSALDSKLTHRASLSTTRKSPRMGTHRGRISRGWTLARRRYRRRYRRLQGGLHHCHP